MSDLLYTPPERPIYEPASNMYVSIIRDNSGNIFQRIYGKTAAMADIFARIFYYCACPAGLEFGEFQTRRDSITPGTWRQSPNTSNGSGIADVKAFKDQMLGANSSTSAFILAIRC